MIWIFYSFVSLHTDKLEISPHGPTDVSVNSFSSLRECPWGCWKIWMVLAIFNAKFISQKWRVLYQCRIKVLNFKECEIKILENGKFWKLDYLDGVITK